MFGCSVRGLIFRITDSSKEQGSNNKKPVNHGGVNGFLVRIRDQGFELLADAGKPIERGFYNASFRIVRGSVLKIISARSFISFYYILLYTTTSSVLFFFTAVPSFAG